MAVEDRFDAVLTFKVEQQQDKGDNVPFFETSVRWSKVEYDGLCAIETYLTEVLRETCNWGLVASMAAGKSENLVGMGLGDRLKELASRLKPAK